jgi:hypothetical protein
VFASRVKSTVRVDNDGTPVNVVIRKLSGRSLSKAAEARQLAVGPTLKSFGPELLQAAREREKPPSEANPDERYGGYDRDSVLTAGIESWDAMDGDGRAVPLIDGIADLDEGSAEIIFHAIVDLSVPTAEEAEEAQGKL